MTPKRPRRTYDHRLVQLVRDSGDISIATRMGVPRSTAAGWVRRKSPASVTGVPGLDSSEARLRHRNARLERRVRLLWAMLRVVIVLLRILEPSLSRIRVASSDKRRLLRAIDRSRGVLGLRKILRIVGLSPSRLHAWRSALRACELPEQESCPTSAPHRLTVAEVAKIREMVKAREFRHVPTGRLAILAQRMGVVFASPSTWLRLVREHGWRRPRLRVHPEGPTVGIRATKANEVWHIDTTIIRLLDGTKAYLHAVIDNFSRRILAWKLDDHFAVGNSVAVLLEAGRGVLRAGDPPMLLADSGVENRNGGVDELIESGLLRRILAMTEIRYSNSMIEAWWRSLKHHWLFLNELDTISHVRKLVDFYVREHNSRLPHSAFRGQTPDEMYFGTGSAVPEKLAADRIAARRDRLEANRALRCQVCA